MGNKGKTMENMGKSMESMGTNNGNHEKHLCGNMRNIGNKMQPTNPNTVT